jgi:hypothetical protein
MAVDMSPEPVTNGLANVAELGLVALIVTLVWAHPFLTITSAVGALLAVMWAVRAVWRTLRRKAFGVQPPAHAAH